MTMPWKIRAAGHACTLVCAIGSSTVRAQSVTFIVNGSVKPRLDCPGPADAIRASASKASRTCGLYWGRTPQSGAKLASGTTNTDGKFKLIPDGASNTLHQRELVVICLPQGDLPCHVHPLAAADYSFPRNSLTIADVELACDSPVADASPAKMADALAALVETYQVLVWAGEQKLDAADAVLKTAVAHADEPLKADERERFKGALAAAVAPLRDSSHQGLPLLPSLKRDDFAGELIAAAPGWRWITRPEKDDRLPAPYAERNGRFEGNVVHRVGSTLGDSLVSLSEGPISVEPETQASLALSWPVSAAARVCLEANPIVPGISWNMRAAVVPGSASHQWDLLAARSAGVKNGMLGIVARSCSDADHNQLRYIPVRAGTAVPNEAAYRIVFLFSKQLWDIDLTVFQGDAASRRKIELPPGAVQLDRDAQTPAVTIDVPAANLDPGLVHLEISGSGPGGFGPEQLSFVHSQRARR